MDLLVSSVLPKSNVGRKAIPAKPELVEALAAAFREKTAEVTTTDGDLSPVVYGPATVFETETKARTDAKRYQSALKESHGRLCTINVYEARENFAGKILDAEGNTLRIVRVFGANPDEARKAILEALGEGETVGEVTADKKYLWRLYVPVSGEDGGRTEPLPDPEDEDAEPQEEDETDEDE